MRGVLLFLSFIFISNLCSEVKVIADFKSVFSRDFYYSDEKGSSVSRRIEDGKVVIDYDVKEGGYAGWGVITEGNFHDYDYLIIRYKGEAILGVKDKMGREERVDLPFHTSLEEEYVEISEFMNLNLHLIENVNFSFPKGKGRFVVDEISLKKEVKRPKVVIDDFNRSTLYYDYFVERGGDASGEVSSTRSSFEGSYALEFSYSIKSDYSGKTFSGFFWRGRTINWKNVKKVCIWVKGDGNENILRFILRDKDGEVYEMENGEILKNLSWYRWEIDLKEITLTGKERNGKFDGMVDYFGFYILNKKAGMGDSVINGKIVFDLMEAEGEEVNAEDASPFYREIKILPPPLNFRGKLENTYFWTPEEKNRIYHFVNLSYDASFSEKFFIEGEIATEVKNFGEVVGEDEEGNFETYFPQFNSPKLLLIGKNIAKGIEEIRVGNLWIDYGVYLFYPNWGFKGVSILNKFSNFLTGELFFIKRRFNSFTVGVRERCFKKDFSIEVKGVYDRETARYPFSGEEWKIGDISREFAYIVSLRRKFRKFDFELSYGSNYKREYAVASNKDPFNPEYDIKLSSSPKKEGELIQLNINGNLLSRLNFSFYLRKIGENFEPRWRGCKDDFGDIYGNQEGYNVRSDWELVRNFHFIYEFDSIKRLSNKNDKRIIRRGGLRVRPVRELEFALFCENKEDRNTKLEKNEEVDSIEFYLRKEYFNNFYFTIDLKREEIFHPLQESQYSTDVFQLKGEYYISSNIKLLFDYVKTRYGLEEWKEIGYPYNDNHFKISFELKF
ncbi:MAG: hypothetical protein DRI36_04040 [Caldiserica bacterium]|nr:MAG: hypothetical protein DRI36_04040 [Caldisericota bacterium]